MKMFSICIIRRETDEGERESQSERERERHNGFGFSRTDERYCITQKLASIILCNNPHISVAYGKKKKNSYSQFF